MKCKTMWFNRPINSNNKGHFFSFNNTFLLLHDALNLQNMSRTFSYRKKLKNRGKRNIIHVFIKKRVKLSLNVKSLDFNEYE